jgi:hypothetical protein
VFDHSVAGLLQALAFSVAKMGAAGLSDLGYLMAALGMAGLTALLVLRPGNRRRLETRFFITYLITLAVLAVSLRTAYNLGFSGAGDSSVYMLSWLAMPVAGFASYATVMALRAVTGRALSIPAAQFSGSQAKVLLAVIILLLCVVNLSAVNYYKAWDGKGIGVLSSHYYYKCLTDQEYYALRYIHDNTPLNATVLVVGLDGTILTYHSVVSERPTISIQEMRTSGETIIAEVLMRYPDPTRPYSNSSGVKISFDMSSREDIYLMTGITRTSLALARQGGSPPASIKQMENVLLSALLKCPGCEYVYHNEQVLVVRVPCALIELPNSPTDTS